MFLDGMERAVAEGIDILMIDTAGRLQNKENLRQNWKRLVVSLNACQKHETFLALDASTGQTFLYKLKNSRKLLLLLIVLTKLTGLLEVGLPSISVRDHILVKLIG